MGEWKGYILEDLCNKITDGAHHSPKEFLGGVPMFSVKDMDDQGFDYAKPKTISEEDYEKLIKSGCQPQVNDILIAKDGSVMKHVFRVKKKPDYVLLSSIAILRPNVDLIDPSFLVYTIKSPEITDTILSNYVSGSGVPRIVLKDFKKVEVKAPPLPEQKSIAAVLSSLDDKIDLLHRQNATLEAMAETLFRQWFVEEAKEEWEDTTLVDHTEAFRGLSYKGSGLAEKGIGLPMHNLNSVYEGGGYKYEGIKYYTGEYRDRHLIHPGDIIVTNTEQGHDLKLIGFPAIVPATFGQKGLFSQHIYKLIPLADTYLSNEFIYYLLMTPVVREQITSATNGSTVNMLAIDGLQRPEFKLPPKNIVLKFTNIASEYWKKKNINQSQILTLTALRDTLLPKLMSGEVRV